MGRFDTDEAGSVILSGTKNGRGPGMALVLLLLSQTPAVAALTPVSLNDLDGYPCDFSGVADYAFDYRYATDHNAWLVRDIERNHYQHALKQMTTETGTGVGAHASGNLDYTLNRMPNHAKALLAIVNYSFSIKKKPAHQRLLRKPECYLTRASMFAKDDPNPHFLFGMYLYRLGKYEMAAAKYADGLELSPHSAEGHYNLGLTLVKLKRYDDAFEHAKEAYKMRFPLPGLKNMLADKGYRFVAEQPAEPKAAAQ